MQIGGFPHASISRSPILSCVIQLRRVPREPPPAIALALGVFDIIVVSTLVSSERNVLCMLLPLFVL
jgi:hypothetical protein